MDARQQPLPISTPLVNLTLGNSMHHITVRLIRSWEARNFKRNGQLMSFELLLVDEAESVIQASIHHRRLLRFKPCLKEGKLYSISNFEIVLSYDRYKVVDNTLTIRFTESTTISEVPETAANIRTDVFRLFTYQEFLANVNTNIHLPDVVGQVLSIEGSKLDDSKSKEKIILLLLVQPHTTVKVTIWDDQAAEFRRLYNNAAQKLLAIVCTSLNPKMFAGVLYLNSTGATRFYLDSKLTVIEEFVNTMGLNGYNGVPAIGDNNAAGLEMESWNVQKIMQHINSGDQREKEVICSAKIVGISSRNGWNYVSCAKCSKKLGRLAATFFCTACDNENAIGVLKFRIEILIDDGTGSSRFVLFDRDARKLTNKSAEDLNISKDIVGEPEPCAEEIPVCIQELVGRSFEFQVKITKFNFTARFQTFTITRVLQEISLASSSTIPSQQAEEADIGGAAKDKISAPKSPTLTATLEESEALMVIPNGESCSGSMADNVPDKEAVGGVITIAKNKKAKKARLA